MGNVLRVVILVEMRRRAPGIGEPAVRGKEEKELFMLPPKPVAEVVKQREEVPVETIDVVMTVRVLGVEDNTAPCLYLDSSD